MSEGVASIDGTMGQFADTGVRLHSSPNFFLALGENDFGAPVDVSTVQDHTVVTPDSMHRGVSVAMTGMLGARNRIPRNRGTRSCKEKTKRGRSRAGAMRSPGQPPKTGRMARFRRDRLGQCLPRRVRTHRLT